MIDVVVLNYNDYETTKCFIETIHDYQIINKIVIVDNNSTDDSFSVLSKLNDAKVITIKTDKNGGYGAGNNFGIKYLEDNSSSEFILLSNPDVIITEEAIIKCFEFLKNHSDYALCAPFMSDKNGIKQYNSAFKIPSKIKYIMSFGLLFSKLFKVSFYKNLENIQDEYKTVDGLSGSCFMMNKQIMLEHGMFDEKIFLYCEEIILGFKMKQANKKLALLPNTTFIHNHSVSISKSYKTRVKRHKLLVKSKLYVIRHYYKAKFFGRIFAWIMANISIVETWLSAIIKRNN